MSSCCAMQLRLSCKLTKNNSLLWWALLPASIKEMIMQAVACLLTCDTLSQHACLTMCWSAWGMCPPWSSYFHENSTNMQYLWANMPVSPCAGVHEACAPLEVHTFTKAPQTCNTFEPTCLSHHVLECMGHVPPLKFIRSRKLHRAVPDLMPNVSDNALLGYTNVLLG